MKARTKLIWLRYTMECSGIKLVGVGLPLILIFLANEVKLGMLELKSS